MTRRSESAEETRQRIVRATYELHAERGIAATTMRDIAERADVAIGTVYHHFPTYDEAIDACGAYTVTLTQPPGEQVLAGIAGPARRLRALADAQFGFYRRFPGYEQVRADRGRFRQIDAFLRAEAGTRRALLAAALAPGKAGRRRLAVAFALLDAAVYRSLLADGLSHAAAVEEVAALLTHCLLGPTTGKAAAATPNRTITPKETT